MPVEREKTRHQNVRKKEDTRRTSSFLGPLVRPYNVWGALSPRFRSIPSYLVSRSVGVKFALVRVNDGGIQAHSAALDVVDGAHLQA